MLRSRRISITFGAIFSWMETMAPNLLSCDLVAKVRLGYRLMAYLPVDVAPFAALVRIVS